LNIEAFLLCDAATQQQGKLNVLGAFDTIFAGKVPVRHPACTIALRIRFERFEDEDHSFKIGVIDEDGNSIGPKLEGNIKIQIPDNTESTVSNFTLNLQQLELKKYGQYRIDLVIDGQTSSSLPFYVREIPKKPIE
jgi:hypothetical protein